MMLNKNGKKRKSALKKSLFITFEGPDGSGKSSSMAIIGQELAAAGYDVLLTKEPGGDAVGRQIRQILLDPQNEQLHPLAEAFLYAADRAQHVQTVILPALAEGKIVLCDRYLDSQIAYQGYGRGYLEKEFLYRLNEMASGGLLPDLTLLLLVLPEIGLQRVKQRHADGADRIESEQMAFHERTYQGYITLAKENPARIHVIDAAPNQNAVFSADPPGTASFIMWR